MLQDVFSGELDQEWIFGGSRSLSELRSVLTDKGRLVIVGGELSGRWFGGLGRNLRAIVLSPFVSQTLKAFISSENAADLRELGMMVESGRLKPVVDRIFPLDRAADGIQYLLDGRASGKVAIRVSSD